SSSSTTCASAGSSGNSHKDNGKGSSRTSMPESWPGRSGTHWRDWRSSSSLTRGWTRNTTPTRSPSCSPEPPAPPDDTRRHRSGVGTPEIFRRDGVEELTEFLDFVLLLVRND